MIKRALPNLLTLGNLFCGCVASTLILVHGAASNAAAFFIAALLLDFLDGFVAKLLGTSSELGKQLDSLADLVSFGFFPATLLYLLLQESMAGSGAPATIGYISNPLPYSAFLITVFSALRLARFNLDTRQQQHFIGLPTPANAVFWVALYFSTVNPPHILSSLLQQPPALFCALVLSCGLLIAPLPMLSLKFAVKTSPAFRFQWALLVLGGLILLLRPFQWDGVLLTLVLYLLLSLLHFMTSKRGLKS